MKTSTYIIPFFVLSLAGLACLPEQAFAKALPFKDIIRQPETLESISLSLAPENTLLLPAQSKTTTWSVGGEPLFLQTPSLKQAVTRTATTTNFDPVAVYEWVKQEPRLVDTKAENARMIVENERVTDFSPGKDGVRPDLRRTTLALLKSLAAGNSTSEAVVFTIPPTNALAETNTYGIQELISGGVSDFTGSSKNRLANIEAGIQQMRGVLIKPGQTFSFGEYLGDVTAAKGFKPEIVIKADGLKPELGGGICQVSSTLFRAVMQSGMAITQRKNHAFSVSHYLPAGTDATIYTPATDLKFVNDTPAHVLIWPYYSGKTGLIFDLYGTRDGRKVVVDAPIQWDKQANGALKASWTRHVTKAGVTRDDVLKSNYLPPALFKKEEKFVTAIPPLPAPEGTPAPPATGPTPGITSTPST